MSTRPDRDSPFLLHTTAGPRISRLIGTEGSNGPG
jgi:hypothetical protein